MPDTFLITAPEAAEKRRFWRPWKWICLVIFIASVTLAPWLPGILRVLGALAGFVLLIDLARHAIRYLSERLFWRVRNRLIGSFIFVGLIPLLLILGTFTLVAYILAGQLAAGYLESSLQSLEQELVQINIAMGERIAAAGGKMDLSAIASLLWDARREQFPRLAARIFERTPDAGYQIYRKFDPHAFLVDFPDHPPQARGDANAADGGLWRNKAAVILVSFRPVPRTPNLFLELSAPLDEHIVDRLQQEKSLYVAFLKSEGSVTRSAGGIQVRIGEKGGDRDLAGEELIRSMEARSRQEQRRTVWWLALLNGWNRPAGNRDVAVVAVLRVPLVVLYDAYLAGYSDFGRGLLIAISVFLGLFLFAELVSLAIGISISRRITRSVHDIYKGMLALGQGDLQHRIPVRRQDQLGLLAHSFNEMTSSITRLLEEVSEKKRLEQELEIAREVQATLFPKQLPRPRGLSIFGGCEPAQTVSGDYYDFIVEDEAHMHIVVADISGKGISAALLMANLQAAMRSQLVAIKRGSVAQIEAAMAHVVSQLNGQLFQNSPTGKYATLFLGCYDAESRELCYCNAGHPPPVLLSDGSIARLEAGGTVIGLFEQASYEARTVSLKPGTVVALFTDGVTEAVNDKDEEYGEERLIESLRRLKGSTPEVIYKQVTDEVRRWQGGQKQHDDITLIIGEVD